MSRQLIAIICDGIEQAAPLSTNEAVKSQTERERETADDVATLVTREEYMSHRVEKHGTQKKKVRKTLVPIHNK